MVLKLGLWFRMAPWMQVVGNSPNWLVGTPERVHLYGY